MQLSGIPGSNLFSTLFGREATPAESAPEPSAPEVSGASAPLEGAVSLRAIVAEYDLRDLSPRRFSELIERLHEAGAVTDAEFQQLAAIRRELEQGGIDPEEDLDLVDFFERKLHAEGQRGGGLAIDGPQPTEAARRHLEWLQKLDLLHQGGAAPLDAMA